MKNSGGNKRNNHSHPNELKSAPAFNEETLGVSNAQLESNELRIRKTRPDVMRSRTISLKQMHKRFRIADEDRELLDEMEQYRPTMRSECRHMPRPCLFIRCKHHLYLDINPVTGSIKINFPDQNPWELKESCALDIAERGGTTLEEVGEIMNLTRERVRQLEQTGLAKLKAVLEGKPVPESDEED